MAISAMLFCHFGCRNRQTSYLGGVFCAFSAMSTAEKRCAICGIALFQIVLGLMCPGGLCRGGESQNGAKSRRFGMDWPSRAFYEGVNPRTILNNCHEDTKRHHNRAQTPLNCSRSTHLTPPVGFLWAKWQFQLCFFAISPARLAKWQFWHPVFAIFSGNGNFSLSILLF